MLFQFTIINHGDVFDDTFMMAADSLYDALRQFERALRNVPTQYIDNHQLKVSIGEMNEDVLQIGGFSKEIGEVATFYRYIKLSLRLSEDNLRILKYNVQETSIEEGEEPDAIMAQRNNKRSRND